MELSKADWKLFRQKIGIWQERYMERLCREYAALLSDEGQPASERFWALNKRMREDKRNPGVLMELQKSNVVYSIAKMRYDGIITDDDIAEFSEGLKDAVRVMLGNAEAD